MHFRLYIYTFVSMYVPWELNPQPFALLTQCSTTEPQEHSFCIVCRSCCYKQNYQQASVCAFDTAISECVIFIGLCLHIVFTYLSIVPQKGHHQKTSRLRM